MKASWCGLHGRRSSYCAAAIACALLVMALSKVGAGTLERYGTTAAGTNLYWTAFAPVGSGTHPAVIVLHVGGFKGSYAGPASVCQDLAGQGYLAFATEYRLAPPGTPMTTISARHPAGAQGGADDGRPPQQTDDVKAAIVAARSDARCTGKVYIVGGSAGGSHGAYCAGTGTRGYDKPDAVALLSPVTNLNDAASLADPNRTNFKYDVENYLNYTVGSSGFAPAAQAASPVTYIHGSVCPIFLLATEYDTMPPQQFTDLKGALEATSLKNYQTQLILESELPGNYDETGFTPHAFDYWDYVKLSVYSFLAAH